MNQDYPRLNEDFILAIDKYSVLLHAVGISGMFTLSYQTRTTKRNNKTQLIYFGSTKFMLPKLRGSYHTLKVGKEYFQM